MRTACLGRAMKEALALIASIRLVMDTGASLSLNGGPGPAGRSRAGNCCAAQETGLLGSDVSGQARLPVGCAWGCLSGDHFSVREIFNGLRGRPGPFFRGRPCLLCACSTVHGPVILRRIRAIDKSASLESKSREGGRLNSNGTRRERARTLLRNA